MVLSSFFGKKPPAGQGDGRAVSKDASERLDSTSTLEITNLGEGRALAAAAGKIQINESQSVDHAAVEEAAVLYANASDDGARAVLEAAIDGAGGRASDMVWRMLFDLYRLIGAKQAFEERGVTFAAQYEISPPIWDEANTQRGPAREAGPSVNLSGTLSGTAKTQFEQLTRIGAKAGKLRIDLNRLKGIDDTGCQLLVATLATLKQQRAKVTLLGARRALDIAQLRLKVGEREAQDFWQLSLALLQQLGEEAAFEDMAVNYAVTFEESPPSYEPPPPAEKTEEEEVTESGGLSLEPIPSQDEFVIEGEIGGAQPEVLRKLAAFASQRNRVEINASKLKRIEFVAAGALFNQLAQFQGQAKLTIIRHPNAMVQALLQVMGIDQVAQIEIKK